MTHASTGTSPSAGGGPSPGNSCWPHAPNATAARTDTMAGQLPSAAACHCGIGSTVRRRLNSLGSRNWSTHMTVVAQGSAIADQLATLKKLLSMFGLRTNHQVSTAAITAMIRQL